MTNTKMWIVSNECDRDIFYFKIFMIENKSDRLFFDSNLVFNPMHQTICLLLDKLLTLTLQETQRERFVQELFIQIKSTEFYRQYYFDDEILDNNGILNESVFNLSPEVNAKKVQEGITCFVPVSDYSYSVFFKLVRNHYCIHRQSIMANSSAITKSEFEIRLINNFLKHEYIDVYHPHNLFYSHQDDSSTKTYFILRDHTLIFAFEAP